jgi:hypothetical protein
MLHLDGNVDVYKIEYNRLLKYNITVLLNLKARSSYVTLVKTHETHINNVRAE